MAGSSLDVPALALGKIPVLESCAGLQTMGQVHSCISCRGDILAVFQLIHLSFGAGELASPRGPRQGVALHLKRSLDACLPNPCQHHGACQVMEDRPVCSCKPGFTGMFCQGRAGDAGQPSLSTGTKGKGGGHGALMLLTTALHHRL